VGGRKTRFEKQKKWTGKGNKGFEKLNILGWEKPTAWRVEVRGVPESRPWSSWNPRSPTARDRGHPLLVRKSHRDRGHPPVADHVARRIVGQIHALIVYRGFGVCGPRWLKNPGVGHSVLRLINNYRYPGHPASLLWVWSGAWAGRPTPQPAGRPALPVLRKEREMMGHTKF